MLASNHSPAFQPGWQFLQIPGPSNAPLPVLEAISRPTIDHRGEEFAQLAIGLGSGLGQLKDKNFRIGHLGHFNDLMLIGTLGGVQLALAASGARLRASGVDAALAALENTEGLAGAA